MSLKLPAEFLERIKNQTYIDSCLLIHSLEEPAAPGIRVNRAKWNKTPSDMFPVPWCPAGYILPERPGYTPDPLYHAGCYYPQESSGMFLEEIFKQLFNDAADLRVLDLCGAPGGKSTHLSSLIGKNGYLVSNEVIMSRSAILAESITKWGVSNTIVTRSDPEAFGNLQGFFDLILVDAPCSGEGMFREQSVVREWSSANAALCSDRQKRIILDVWPALKEGGFMIYSTCTFNPAENEINIRWLNDNRKSEPVRIDISNYEGITEIDHDGVFGYGFFPGKIKGDGLFISVIRKTTGSDKRHIRTKFSGNVSVNSDERKIAGEWTCFNEDSLLKVGNLVVSMPCSNDDYAALSGWLAIIKPGTDIFTAKAKNRVPAHDISMSVYFRQDSLPSVDLDLSQSLSYLSRGPIAANNTIKGWGTVKYEGIPLGFINNIGSRINNYYPVGWRIRMDSTRMKHATIINWD